ncbi:DUF1127 domain-containing protein [Devosia sp. CN2-171]|uniref:DUF1127 domain-containing protein n=1 Tax=Devosia sp. CN2-171 TaxID=3400909 RepID=UPI003BF8F33B
MLEELFRRFSQWLWLHDDIERLRQQDDHILADIGIARGQIPAFVRGELTTAEPAWLPVRGQAVMSSPHPHIPRRRGIAVSAKVESREFMNAGGSQ